jgi:demethylmenaquinone methyltransferase/2-methoxy-6-polyprenyl-1,4-benzoquinol methylase
MRWTAGDAAALAGLLAESATTGAGVLDIGGGTGGLASLLAQALECPVTVVDSDERAVREAGVLDGITAVCADATALPFGDGVFDAAILFDALHHVVDQERAIREVARVVRIGGVVVACELDPRVFRVQVTAVPKRVHGERPVFLEPAVLARLFAATGVDGECETGHGGSYVFRGVRVSC